MLLIDITQKSSQSPYLLNGRIALHAMKWLALATNATWHGLGWFLGLNIAIGEKGADLQRDDRE
jgi:hypothetical protein